MEGLKQKLLILLSQTGLHISLQKAAEAFLAFIIVGGAVTTTAVTIIPAHHKISPPKPPVHKTVVATKPAKTVKKPTPAASQTTTAPASPTPAKPAATPTKVAESPKPLPATLPSPGSGVKTLVPTTAPASSGSTSTNTGGTTPSPTAPALATGGYDSTNWSGYAATSGSYTAVSGTWTVPAVTGNGTTTAGDAAWVGIGGVSSNDLIQAGTEDTVDPSGTVSTFAFYELLPAASLEIPSLDVSTGDSVSVAINEVSPGQWTISITDNTTGQNYTTSVSYSSSNSSAEWIEEDPSYVNGSLVPFVDFDHVIFSDGETTDNDTQVNIGTSNAFAIQLVDGSSGDPIVTPSELIDSGAGFWAIHD